MKTEISNQKEVSNVLGTTLFFLKMLISVKYSFQLFRWNGLLFEKLTSGIQTFNGMSVDTISTSASNLLLVVGNHINRLWNSYEIPSNIYSWSSQTGFSLCGGIETNKVMHIDFMKVMTLS